jgi:Uma2 family endonuclease
MLVIPIPTHHADTSLLGPPQGKWTFADWEQLPEDGNLYEIIDGFLYMTTAPSPKHQGISGILIEILGGPARRQGIAYYYAAPIGVIMPGCDPVQPDFVMIRKERADIIEPDERIYGVPDLLIEIISPGSRKYDEGIKLDVYARCGVPEYAVIDPAARVMRVYELAEIGRYSAPIQFGAGESVTFNIAPSISVPIAALFEGAPDKTL